jgi:hypothetical protein
VRQDKEAALTAALPATRFTADVHLPTKHMAAHVFSLSPAVPNGHHPDFTVPDTAAASAGDTVIVRVQPLLEFLRRYQAAEDDARELKLAQGLGSGGKVRGMCASFPGLAVRLHDARLDAPRYVLSRPLCRPLFRPLFDLYLHILRAEVLYVPPWPLPRRLCTRLAFFR